MSFAKYFDHTVLRPDCSLSDVHKICDEAREFDFASVCIPPYFVKEAAARLDGSKIITSTVIGFPMGYSSTAAKVEEIKRALAEGATEFDGVINICAVKSGNWNFVQSDIDRMVTAVHLKGKSIKIILETGLLTPEELKRVCEICLAVEPDFVKTSTGFNGPGATVEMVSYLYHAMRDKVAVKASGGIRTLEQAEAMIAAGAKRLGSSSSVAIVKEKGV